MIRTQPQTKARIERIFTVAVIAMWVFVPIAAVAAEHRVDPHVMGIAATGMLSGWLTSLLTRKFFSVPGSYPFFVSYMLVDRLRYAKPAFRERIGG